MTQPNKFKDRPCILLKPIFLASCDLGIFFRYFGWTFKIRVSWMPLSFNISAADLPPNCIGN